VLEEKYQKLLQQNTKAIDAVMQSFEALRDVLESEISKNRELSLKVGQL
jgi:uncharacterized protein Yka (UPF0111/DUF47 family)